MNALALKYKRVPKHYLGASAWNEVSKKQLLLWIGVMYSALDEEMKLQLAIPIFFNVPIAIFKDIRNGIRLQIIPYLAKLLNDNRLDVWLMPSLCLFFKNYYGPADKLSNLTAYEFFNVCEPLYWKFKTKGDISALTSLCAALYRPKRKGEINNDIREAITDAGISKRSRLFRYLPLNTRRAIAFNYEGCRNFIVKLHPQVFKSGNGNIKTGRRAPDITINQAGGPLGNLQETRGTNLYDFLNHLVTVIEREEDLKAM